MNLELLYLIPVNYLLAGLFLGIYLFRNYYPRKKFFKEYSPASHFGEYDLRISDAIYHLMTIGATTYLLFTTEFYVGLLFGGFVLLFFSSIYRAWTLKYLKKYWTPIVEKKGKLSLIRKGPYKNTRHPLFTSWFIETIAIGIIAPHPVILLGVLINTIITIIRLQKEEQMLMRKLKDYDRYARRTGALTPWF
ncbi:MAG: isoprenylcysteine carboxylmethyltransferase family protein [Candidatus Diapherotrites archaeon]|nr:isoprenylcysteine carboxylmethyltransferase family protein [Candidatus Diapherotrites archaeon]